MVGLDEIWFVWSVFRWSNNQVFSVLEREDRTASPLKVDVAGVEVVRLISQGLAVGQAGCSGVFCAMHSAVDYIGHLW